MQDYPVYQPEKYAGLSTLSNYRGLDNSSSNLRSGINSTIGNNLSTEYKQQTGIKTYSQPMGADFQSYSHSKFNNQATNAYLTSKVDNYMTNAVITSKADNYLANASLNSKVNNYLTDAKITSSLNDKFTEGYLNAQTYNQLSANLRQKSPPSVVSARSRIKTEVIKSDSRIQYIPIEKKVIDYVDEPRYTLVAKKKLITDYRDQVRVDIVPREVNVTDYYAIEHIRSYIPEIIPEKAIDIVAHEKTNVKFEYIPVERQIVHMPQHSHESEAPRYLGVKETAGPRIYQNVRESDIQFWEQEYGYVRGESIEILNRKIMEKSQRDKQLYFKQFESQATRDFSRSR